ncbi:hypothetical protein NMG60_11017986 [Bertholletia excelsa]
MVSDPSLMFYACVAKGSEILAEFNSKDADLATLAAKCLEKTPPLHSVFSHTIRKRTYTFFIDEPFTYFAIYDAKLEKVEALSFLKSVREAVDELVVSENGKSLSNLTSHCFQGELYPVFHQLLAPYTEFGSPLSPKGASKNDRSISLDSPKGKIGSLPLLGGDVSKNLKKKKKRLDAYGDGIDGLVDSKVDVSGDAVVTSRNLSVSMQKHGMFANDSGHQKARRAWKKHVWVVLSLDLFVCTILFVIWLLICRGFKCIDD